MGFAAKAPAIGPPWMDHKGDNVATLKMLLEELGRFIVNHFVHNRDKRTTLDLSLNGGQTQAHALPLKPLAKAGPVWICWRNPVHFHYRYSTPLYKFSE